MTFRRTSPTRSRWGWVFVLLGLGWLPLAGLADSTNSWRVFRALSSDVAVGNNLLSNPGMETVGVNPPLASWSAFGSGYALSTGSVHGGARAMQCIQAALGEVHGASQNLVLNRTNARVLKLSGWSKAQGVTGSRDADYSVYLDILYANGTWLYGQTIQFSPGTHDWEYQEAFILPAAPIKQLSCYALFRNSHVGTVWFDDISLVEVQGTVVAFDGAPVLASVPSPLPFNTSARFSLASMDGLRMQITQDGGVIEELGDGAQSLQAAGMDYASGWLICDRGATSDWWNVGGAVTELSGVLRQRGVITNLNLAAQVTYSMTNDAVRIQAAVSNLVAGDRAITLYFALPAAMDSGSWWHSPRDRSSVTQSVESATLSSVELGARNLVNRYPLATVSDKAALTLAVPPDQFRPYRLVYNRVTRQFFAAFDLGLSAIPTNFQQSATAEVWLYRSDPAWGLRSGLEGYYRRFPAAFTRNFTNEGIWVAFADIRGITNISDYGIAYHEIGYNTAFVKFDDTNGIQSFRYVSEPWSYWMPMPTNLSNTDYATVTNYLVSQHTRGVKAATATLSSGLRETSGRLQFLPAAAPWCPYGAVFSLNSSPFISDSLYSSTKFSNEWNSVARDVYQHPENGILDGEYIDSFAASATSPDYSSNHLRTTSFPLTYRAGNPALMTPLIIGTYEMARAIAADLHAMGRPIIANTLFTLWPGLPIGIGLFDFTGTEMNFFDAAGNFVPPGDSTLLYARSLSGIRPYGYLLNTDFSKVSNAEMESYMRICAVYGIYPSAFSADAASNNYFEQPALFERDRALFKKYIPMVRALSLAGWQPVTGATSSHTNCALEAYGDQPSTGSHYLGVRNLGNQSITANVSFDLGTWAFPGAQWLRFTNLFDGAGGIVDVSAGGRSISLTMAAGECRVYRLVAGPPSAPMIVTNDDVFGIQSGQFGFRVRALSGQVVVVESSDDLAQWTARQTNAASSGGHILFQEPSPASVHRYYRARGD